MLSRTTHTLLKSQLSEEYYWKYETPLRTTLNLLLTPAAEVETALRSGT